MAPKLQLSNSEMVLIGLYDISFLLHLTVYLVALTSPNTESNKFMGTYILLAECSDTYK
jgi:hypothetical protein